MTWVLRLAALVAAFFFLRWLWRWFWRTGWQRLLRRALGPLASPPPPAERHGVMKRDPVCGTYVDVELSVPARVGGETLYFCSERCRSAYLSRGGAAAHKTG